MPVRGVILRINLRIGSATPRTNSATGWRAALGNHDKITAKKIQNCNAVKKVNANLKRSGKKILLFIRSGERRRTIRLFVISADDNFKCLQWLGDWVCVVVRIR